MGGREKAREEYKEAKQKRGEERGIESQSYVRRRDTSSLKPT